jgi:tetratricopeptide (TPR) repeat protein
MPDPTFLWALNIMPNLPDADIVLTRVGDTYKFEGDHNAAKDIYRRVVNMFPDTDGALVSRIRLAESPARTEGTSLGDLQGGGHHRRLQDLPRDSHQVSGAGGQRAGPFEMGVYYFKKKDFEQAMDSLLGLIRDNPNTIFKPQINYTANLIALGMMEDYHKKGKPMELMNTYLQFRSSLDPAQRRHGAQASGLGL